MFRVIGRLWQLLSFELSPEYTSVTVRGDPGWL